MSGNIVPDLDSRTASCINSAETGARDTQLLKPVLHVGTYAESNVPDDPPYGVTMKRALMILLALTFVTAAFAGCPAADDDDSAGDDDSAM
jgi:hypothetical protein